MGGHPVIAHGPFFAAMVAGFFRATGEGCMTHAMIWQRRIFAAGALVCIAAVVFQLTPPTSLQVVLLVLLVALVGLPHGALDPLVAWRAQFWRTPRGLVYFLSAYLALGGLTLALWVHWPGLALAAFLAYSAWHFSADWQETLPRPLAIAGGALVIAGPSLFHRAETAELFALLAHASIAEGLTTFLPWVAMAALIGIAIAFSSRITRDRATAIELGLLVCSVAILPPLLFFLVYFCGLHSPRHLLHALEGVKPRLALGVGGLFTALAVAGGFLALSFMPSMSLTQQSIQLVFTGLAVLTVPHMLLIEIAATRNP
jgi:Brp/Blh family beta-carotene 15,15'-monooxygenase